MDIKEVAENFKAVEDFKEKVSEESTFTIPEDSTCITDIDSICSQVTDFIEESLEGMKKEADPQKKSLIIDSCMDALKMVEMYKNIRLNVELSRKIKFNISPKATKE